MSNQHSSTPLHYSWLPLDYPWYDLCFISFDFTHKTNWQSPLWTRPYFYTLLCHPWGFTVPSKHLIQSSLPDSLRFRLADQIKTARGEGKDRVMSREIVSIADLLRQHSIRLPTNPGQEVHTLDIKVGLSSWCAIWTIDMNIYRLTLLVSRPSKLSQLGQLAWSALYCGQISDTYTHNICLYHWFGPILGEVGRLDVCTFSYH